MSETTRAQLVTQLAKCNAAIEAATTASSYGVADQSVQREQLANLRAHRTHLEREIAAIDAFNAGATNPAASTATWD